jgi:hypothetical protein
MGSYRDNPVGDVTERNNHIALGVVVAVIVVGLVAAAAIWGVPPSLLKLIHLN